MASLDQATLRDEERVVLDRFLSKLRRRLGDDLHAVWLFGSRARGEAIGALSDIDVLLIVDHAGWDDAASIYETLHDAAREAGMPHVGWAFSLHVHEPRWLRQRRAVGSFFIAEIDRDRIDLTPTA